MPQAQFDPARSVEFDLGKGQVKLEGSLSRVVVSSEALVELMQGCQAETLQKFGHRLGSEAGRRVADRLGRELQSATIEALVDQLGGELALMGLGALGAERWGRALVVTIDDSPWGHQGDAVLAALLQGALETAFDRKSAVLQLPCNGTQARLLVVGQRAQSKVQSWLANGDSWGTIIEKLHSGDGSSR